MMICLKNIVSCAAEHLRTLDGILENQDIVTNYLKIMFSNKNMHNYIPQLGNTF